MNERMDEKIVALKEFVSLRARFLTSVWSYPYIKLCFSLPSSPACFDTMTRTIKMPDPLAEGEFNYTKWRVWRYILWHENMHAVYSPIKKPAGWRTIEEAIEDYRIERVGGDVWKGIYSERLFCYSVMTSTYKKVSSLVDLFAIRLICGAYPKGVVVSDEDKERVEKAVKHVENNWWRFADGNAKMIKRIGDEVRQILGEDDTTILFVPLDFIPCMKLPCIDEIHETLKEYVKKEYVKKLREIEEEKIEGEEKEEEEEEEKEEEGGKEGEKKGEEIEEEKIEEEEEGGKEGEEMEKEKIEGEEKEGGEKKEEEEEEEEEGLEKLIEGSDDVKKEWEKISGILGAPGETEKQNYPPPALTIPWDATPLARRLVSALSRWREGWDEKLDIYGDDIDMDEYLIGARKIFYNEERIKFDAVSIILDHSGSMLGTINSCNMVVSALSRTISLLKGKCSVWVFDGKYIWTIKTAKEHWSPRIDARLAGINYAGGTPLAEVYYKLKNQLEKVVITITDGMPDDVMFCKRMITELKQKGHRMVAIGIGNREEELVYLARDLGNLGYDKTMCLLASEILTELPKMILNLVVRKGG